MKVIGLGRKIVDMFEIEELTSEAFEAGRIAAGWEYETETGSMIHKTVKAYGEHRIEEVDARVDCEIVCVEMEMQYRDYKTQYSACRTKSGSYNKDTKMITVYVPTM